METLPEEEEFVFVPAAPFTWTSAPGRVGAPSPATHEAQHAVCGVLLGVEVLEVRVDRPDPPGTLGHCAWIKHADRWRNAAASIAPLVMDGTAPPAPDLHADDQDLWHASVHWWDAFEQERPTWPALLDIVRSLLTAPAGKRAVRAVSGALLAEGAIPGDRVVELVREAGAGP